MAVEVVTATGAAAALGECPVWSAVESVLYWVDVDGTAVHRFDPGNGGTETRALPGRPGSLVLTGVSGQLIVAMEHQLMRLDWATGTFTPWISLEAPDTGNRLNDGRCDPAGRFVVGSMYADTTAGRRTGILHQVEESGASTQLKVGIGVTNGLAFDPTRRRMYFADTPTETVVVFDYDPETGRATNERLFFDYRDVPGMPDGACVDADGCYWSASVYGWAVIRITPDGTLDRRIDLPVEKPSMPCFGGDDMGTLYVTTISSGGTVRSAPGRDGFLPGTLLAIDASVTGVAEPTFGLPCQVSSLSSPGTRVKDGSGSCVTG